MRKIRSALSRRSLDTDTTPHYPDGEPLRALHPYERISNDRRGVSDRDYPTGHPDGDRANHLVAHLKVPPTFRNARRSGRPPT